MKKSSRKNIVPVVVFFISLIITVISFVAIRNNLSEQLFQRFTNQSKQITSLIQQRMNLYINVMYGAQGLFAASQSIEKSEWKAYAEQLDLAKNYSGITALIYTKRVSKDATSSYPYTIYPYQQKSSYYPITYVATSSISSTSASSTTSIFGFDASSDPIRWKAMQESAKTDTPQASGLVLTISTRQPSFSVYAPIYNHDADTTTIKQRLENLSGFVYASFRLDNLFKGLVADPVFDKNIDLEIYDTETINGSASSTLLFDKDNLQHINEDSYSLRQSDTIIVGGRTWNLVYVTLPEYESSTANVLFPYIVLLGGGILSVLLGGLLYSYSSAKDRATILAESMTKSLKESEEKYRAIFDSFQDVFYRTNQEGTITIVSPSIEKYTGIPAHVLVGRNALDFYPDKSQRENMLAELQKKGTVSDYPLSLSAKGNTIINVSLNARLLFDEYKKPIGVEGVLRDVSERRKAENDLKVKTDELERLNALMIGRELKMVELKKILEQVQAK